MASPTSSRLPRAGGPRSSTDFSPAAAKPVSPRPPTRPQQRDAAPQQIGQLTVDDRQHRGLDSTSGGLMRPFDRRRVPVLQFQREDRLARPASAPRLAPVRSRDRAVERPVRRRRGRCRRISARRRDLTAFALVTRSTSSIVVRPARTFRQPSSAACAFPCELPLCWMRPTVDAVVRQFGGFVGADSSSYRPTRPR